MMLTLLTGMSAFATSLVFLGGAVYGTSTSLGLVFTVVGGGWLGILHASLIRAATRGQVDAEPSLMRMRVPRVDEV